MNYTEDARYYQYIIESSIEHEKISGFIKTVIGESQGVSAKKLLSIHEAVGDKIRRIWDKFIAFLNRVWAKFVDYTNRLIQSDSDYLEKYRDIILNKKPEDLEIEMRDYPTGIHRMASTIIPAFNTVKKDIPIDDTDISFKSKLIPKYEDANQDFTGFCTAYFQGGEDNKKTNLKNLNLTDLYNYCHDFKKIESAIQKDKDTISKTYNDLQSLIQKATSEEKKDGNGQQATSTNSGTNSGTPTSSSSDSKVKTAADIANSGGSTRGKLGSKELPFGTDKGKGVEEKQDGWHYKESSVDKFLSTYFTEEIKIGGASSGSNNNTAGNSAVTSGDSGKASNNMHSVQKDSTPAKIDDGVDLDTLTKQVGIYNTVASAVLTAKMTSSQVIFKDYMKILKLHIGHHVGKDGDTHVAKSGSNYKSALKIDNPDDVLKKIDAINAAKDNNEKHKLTVALNDEIKSKNPNFPGGIEAIRKAAEAAKNNTNQ